MDWIVTKYSNLLSNRLEKFKKIGNNFNFRCIVCGDSKKNSNKARGWILTERGKARFYCHNCGAGMSFPKFLKLIDPNMYYEYVKDCISEKSGDSGIEKPDVVIFAEKMKKPEFVKQTGLNILKKISQLPPSHYAKQYVTNRHIPTAFHHKLFFTENFKSWVNDVAPNTFKSVEYDEPRLIIPLLTSDKQLFGVQGRSFNPKSNAKYLTMLFDDSSPKIYGLENVDIGKRVCVVEGPIDSMFLVNSIASCGGKLSTNLSSPSLLGGEFTIVYDNEPRNKETVDKIQHAINDGYDVCIWPLSCQYKDINDMVNGGISPTKIQEMINDNTYKGLMANMQLAMWRKC